MLQYAVITPARDEAESLPRLAAALAAQTQRPEAWVVVDTGSHDGTVAVAQSLAAAHPWISVVVRPGGEVAERGGPVVRGIHAGLAAAASLKPPVVVVANADVSMSPRYFERLLAEFGSDARLGIASGSRYELEAGAWRQRRITGTSVEAQCRAYRWECLCDVLPLEERIGWDGLDEIKANVAGWRTRTFLALPFRHHRAIGAREPSRTRAWIAQGEAAWYMGYRWYYLLLRSLHHGARDRRAAAMVRGYAIAAAQRRQRHPDPAVRSYVRRQQRLRNLPVRIGEALGLTRAAP
jgi:biofilm PGA synthesis N-glycosyltransferase PgaC